MDTQSYRLKYRLLRAAAMLTILPMLSITIKAQGIYIGSGTNFIAANNVQIVLNNTGLTNNGTFANNNDTVVFTGNSATASSFIAGSNITFNNISIKKTANDVQLNTNIAVNNSLFFFTGNLQLNNFNTDLGSSYGRIISESNTARIIGTAGGTVTKTAVLNAPTAANPGSIGVNITSTANLGSTLITRGHTAQTVSGTEQSINRWFNIVPSYNTALNATLQFNFFTGELNGLTEANLVFWSSNNSGSTWSDLGETSINTTANWVSLNSIASLNLFTLAPPASSPGAIIRTGPAIASVSTQPTINKVYPNPAADHVNIEFTAPIEKDYEIALYAPTGQLLELKVVHANIGVNTVYWPLKSHAAGVYYFVLDRTLLKPAKVVIGL